MFDFDAKTKVFLIVMGWALVLYYWEKQKPKKEEFQNSLLMLIALVLIGIFATMIETMH